MIKNIMKMLQLSTFYGESENIDIAKGINQYTLSPKKLIKKKIRECLQQKR
jgi:hypothetical protein